VTREAAGRSPRRSAPDRDPYGIGPVSGYVGPIVAIVGLVAVAIVTLNLLQGQIPLLSNPKPGDGGNGGDGGVNATPAPSNVVVTPPDTVFDGSILYAKAGNIWIQTGTDARQLTTGGNDSMPAYSADGSSIYFIRIRATTAKFPTEGFKARSWYDLFTPQLMQMKADGSGAKVLLSGRYIKSGSAWFYWLRQPAPSPDGKTIAVISDGPNPLQSDIVLQTFTPASKQLKSLGLPESLSLGHQDPAWGPDGRFLYYVRNGRDGTKGAPQIFRYDPKAKKTRALTGPGYLAPAVAPNSRWLAATRTDAFGTDIVILDGSGTEVLRVTDDGHSFSPVWSPAGNALAFLHLSGTSVDLRMVKLDSSSGSWAVTTTVDLTKVSGLDGTSHPSWFIPADQLPAASPTPASSGGGSAAPTTAP
jgi:Tol biopolymer transport system component